MEYALLTVLAAVLITMLLALGRAMAGPTVFDRILAVNMFTTEVVLLICLICFITGRPDFLDLALLYALLNFIGSIGVLKFVRYGAYDQAEFDTET